MYISIAAYFWPVNMRDLRDLTWGFLQWNGISLGLEFYVGIIKCNNCKIYTKKSICKKFYVQKLWDDKMFIQELIQNITMLRKFSLSKVFYVANKCLY